MGARIVLALCAGPLLAGAAAAQEADWYQAVSFGAATTRIPESVISVAGGGASTLGRDERDPGVKVLVGHAFSRHWAVEGGLCPPWRVQHHAGVGVPLGRCG
jgi:hypothetical protein